VTNFGTKIEYELEQSGVALLAADEGITDDALPNASVVLARKRATPILTRRVSRPSRSGMSSTCWRSPGQDLFNTPSKASTS
jgi:hypothetical protein